MTPKDKAEELVDRFSEYSHTDFDYSRGGYQIDTQIQNAKQCALIAVDELIEQQQKYNNGSFYPSNYWSEVKAEIEML